MMESSPETTLDIPVALRIRPEEYSENTLENVKEGDMAFVPSVGVVQITQIGCRSIKGGSTPFIGIKAKGDDLYEAIYVKPTLLREMDRVI